MQVKLRPEGDEHVFVLPRLRIQVSVSPPSQPEQVWVPSELSVQKTSKLDALALSGSASKVNSSTNLRRLPFTSQPPARGKNRGYDAKTAQKSLGLGAQLGAGGKLAELSASRDTRPHAHHLYQQGGWIA
jgi:hypothetical protein